MCVCTLEWPQNRNPVESSYLGQISEVVSDLAKDRDNVFIIPPKMKLSSYYLLLKCNLTVYWWSTLGRSELLNRQTIPES